MNVEPQPFDCLVLSASTETVVSDLQDGLEWSKLHDQINRNSWSQPSTGPAEPEHVEDDVDQSEPWRPPPCHEHASLRSGPYRCPACGPYRADQLKTRIVNQIKAAERRGHAVARFDIEAVAHPWEDDPIRRTKKYMADLADHLADVGMTVLWVWALELGPRGGMPHVHGILIIGGIADDWTTEAEDSEASYEARFKAAAKAARLSAGSPAGLAWAEAPHSVAACVHYVLKGMLGTRDHPADPAAHVALNGYQVAHGTTKFNARKWR